MSLVTSDDVIPRAYISHFEFYGLGIVFEGVFDNISVVNCTFNRLTNESDSILLLMKGRADLFELINSTIHAPSAVVWLRTIDTELSEDAFIKNLVVDDGMLLNVTDWDSVEIDGIYSPGEFGLSALKRSKAEATKLIINNAIVGPEHESDRNTIFYIASHSVILTNSTIRVRHRTVVF
jgi:hypothetical protein